jgi:hypothetical protein
MSLLAAGSASCSAPAAPKPLDRGAAMKRLEESASASEEADESQPDGLEEESTKPETAPIDEDVAGSVNAAVHDADE